MSDWISVKERLPELDADNCCMDEEDYGRYSVPVWVFDEDEARSLGAFYDGVNRVWHNSETELELHGVTHWMPLPEPPK